jgi:hypothetical protein
MHGTTVKMPVFTYQYNYMFHDSITQLKSQGLLFLIFKFIQDFVSLFIKI